MSTLRQIESSTTSRLRAAGCVFAEDEARLLMAAASSPAALTRMVDRRVAGLPLEHVVGWAEFSGMRIAVDPGVFVPRRRTEFLARLAAAAVHDVNVAAEDKPAVVVDLCCGSGAVGVAVAAMAGQVHLHAVDVDPAAVRCARRNVGSTGKVYRGDLYEGLPTSIRRRVDVVVANAPYVPSDALALMPREARLYEPRWAHDGGSDGVDILRRVAEGAPTWLAPGGRLLVETSETQSERTAAALADYGLTPEVATSGELGATVVSGTLPADGIP